MLDNYFNYKKHRTDFKTEVVAGVSTFLTMAYIMFLNPLILSEGGFDRGGVFTATACATALACFICAFYAKTWPVGLAPGNGNKCICCLRCLSWNAIHARRGFRCCISCRCGVLNNFTYTDKGLVN